MLLGPSGSQQCVWGGEEAYLEEVSGEVPDAVDGVEAGQGGHHRVDAWVLYLVHLVSEHLQHHVVAVGLHIRSTGETWGIKCQAKPRLCVYTCTEFFLFIFMTQAHPTNDISCQVIFSISSHERKIN